MAKGAVNGLTLSLAAELAPKVRVNAIAPSLTRTPLAASILASEQMAAAVAGMHAMQRLGTAEDIAALTAFLLSHEADWITGQIIGVDGGRSTLRTQGLRASAIAATTSPSSCRRTRRSPSLWEGGYAHNVNDTVDLHAFRPSKIATEIARNFASSHASPSRKWMILPRLVAGGSGGGNSAIVPCNGSRLPAPESGM
jgi:hypothetical protein